MLFLVKGGEMMQYEGMTILEQLKKYCEYCINDTEISELEDYISCVAHKWACMRFLKDIELIEKGESEFYWDEEEVKRFVLFCSKLHHFEGVLAGEKVDIRANGWQLFVCGNIYGFKKKRNGTRRFKKAFIEVARKNAKTQLEACMAAYDGSIKAAENKEIAQIYSAGTVGSQSRYVFNGVKNQMRHSKLKRYFKMNEKKIVHIKTSSEIIPLTKDGAKDGGNPSLLILDEYHEHKTKEFYDLFKGANRKESLLVIITTAGKDLNVPCYIEEYPYCKKILNPYIDVENNEYFVDICEVDEEDIEECNKDKSKYGDIKLWKKANPVRCTYIEGVEAIRTEWNTAKEIRQELNPFKTKLLNIWCAEKKDQYMDMAKWKKCECKKYPIDIKGKKAFVAFDIASKLDLCSYSIVIPYENGKVNVAGEKDKSYILFSKGFVPTRESLKEHETTEKVNYTLWEEMGYIKIANEEGSDSEIINQFIVLKDAIDKCKELGVEIQQVGFDPHDASMAMAYMEKQGYEVISINQSPAQLNEPTMYFRAAVYENKLHYLTNPVLNYCMSNAIMLHIGNLVKIDKKAVKEKIDEADSSIFAFMLAYNYKPGTSLDELAKQWYASM